jgi:prophage tail gpP-like protein
MTAPQPQPDQLTLTVGGMIYAGWKEIVVSRHIDHMASGFSIGLTERWAGQNQPWPIMPFAPCTIKIGNDLVLTGYVDGPAPGFTRASHTVTVSGRSKTSDLLDCTPDIKSGQFKGYTLEQIARAVCQLFSIDVLVQTPATQIFPDATLQRCETAFAFLERLARLAGVLLTDDSMGRLVLTTAGTARATTRLVEGQNIEAGSAKLDGRRRFSQYIVKGQHALAAAAANWGGAGGTGSASSAAAGPVIVDMKAVALDTAVPRYRPKVTLAEAQLDQAGMQRRASWERNYAFGRATEADITVQGWRQVDGTLWAINQLVPVTSPWLQIDQDLLIAGTTFKLDDSGGRTTALRLGPIEGFTPDPGQVKLHAKRGKKGKTAPNWDGAGISG